MAIDVVWEQMRWSDDPLEPGETQVLAVVRDEHSLVERFLVDFRTADLPHLRFVPQLAKELEALHDQDHHPDVAKHLNAVLDLVRNAYGSKHTRSLHFGQVDWVNAERLCGRRVQLLGRNGLHRPGHC